MRFIATLTTLAALIAFTVPAEAALPVNPVFNGGFEIYVPFARETLRDAGISAYVGVGHQVLGCSATTRLIWEEDSCGQRATPEQAAGQILADPAAEANYWLFAQGQRGDLVIVNPTEQSAFKAANWAQYPASSVEFRDVDANLEREAVVVAPRAFLYQTFAATSTHSAVPVGMVEAVTLRLEGGDFAGASFQFVLDSFPLESVADWPVAFYNYQLTGPSTLWTVSDGVVTIDPLLGTLSGPASGGYILPGADEHPTAAQWNAASPEERRAMLMEFRATQISLWDLPAGMILDDVAMELRA